MNNKLRILLFVLTLLFFATAFSVKKAINDIDILELESKSLGEKLQRKEQLIDELFSDSLVIKTFINSERYPLQVREISNSYQHHQIYIYIYKDNKPIFWSTNVYVPETDAGIKPEASFINAENYSFFVKKKQITGSLNILALIPIQRNFNPNYQARGNPSFRTLISNTQLQVADFGDNDNIKNIYTKDKVYLFSVKLKSSKYSNIYLNIQLLCWGLGTLCSVVLITTICFGMAKAGRALWSILLLIATFVVVRYIDLETNWLSQISNYKLFSPKVYAYNYISPNLWSFLINSIVLLWILCYILSIRKYIVIPEFFLRQKHRPICYYLVLLCTYFLYSEILNQLSTLITHSSFENEELITLFFSYDFTIYHILIFTINIVSIILIANIVVILGRKLSPNIINNINLQLMALVTVLIISGFYQDFTVIYILLGLLILTSSFEKSLLKNDIYTQVITFITLSILSTILYAEAIKVNTKEHMKMILLNLESDDDVQAVSLFSKIEHDISKDAQLKRLIQIASTNPNPEIINSYIQKNYLSGYLSNYNFTAYYYFNGMPINNYSRDQLQVYREKVINHSSKVNHTQNFYKLKTEIGHYDYFALINSSDVSGNDYSIILNLKKNINSLTAGIPFLSGNINSQNFNHFSLKNFNFAIYKKGVLISQNGKYTYPNTDKYVDKPIDEFIAIDDVNEHNHLILRPNNETTLIVSTPTQSYWQYLTVISVTFLYLYITLGLLQLLFQFIPIYIKRKFTLKNLYQQLRYIFSRIRYSTRIQTLVIASVLIAIVISGIISFFSIKIQTEKSRKDQKLEYIASVVHNLEQISSLDSTNNLIEALYTKMSNLNDVMVTNFNLYDKNGKLFFTTQPSIYNHNLISSYINPNAYLELNVLKKNESLIYEQIVDFKYESAYAAIKDSNYKTIAYLGIPYFDYEIAESENINILLKTILNIYTIILIIFAFLAVYISNKITEPLQIIRKKLSQTNLSDKPNESLYWEKDDEIGLLVKEYNYMLVKLEENAKQLRNAERESVWREMAQQVAHEIKNPLTPMKLGIQQLTRSFRDQDERFPERFEKISNSFIEQIETLSRIASEFSAFAKLPEAKFEAIELIPKINKSIHVYNNTPNVKIELINENTSEDNIKVYGDRGQMIRTFNNLLKNAIEATTGRRKPHVTITIKNKDQDNILIEISDNGYGIPEHVIPKIFKPNFTTKSSGTGLGLAFVKQSITGMGGSIDFKTKLNHGTTFFITLPIYKG